MKLECVFFSTEFQNLRIVIECLTTKDNSTRLQSKWGSANQNKESSMWVLLISCRVFCKENPHGRFEIKIVVKHAIITYFIIALTKLKRKYDKYHRYKIK